MFGVFLFVTYYLQDTLDYSPVVTGVAFLPMAACIASPSNLSNIVLMPRIGPRPMVASGLLAAAGGEVWFTRIGPARRLRRGRPRPAHPGRRRHRPDVLPRINTGTYGVAPQDAGVASATVNTGQQLGGSIGTSLLNTIFAAAVASYLAAHLAAARLSAARP